MCNNCNCDNYDKCSICYLYDEEHTCLANKGMLTTGTKSEEKRTPILPISTTIEDGLLKVVVEEKGKEIPIYIDLQKQLDS